MTTSPTWRECLAPAVLADVERMLAAVNTPRARRSLHALLGALPPKLQPSEGPRRVKVPAAVRREVIVSSNGICAYCGTTMVSQRNHPAEATVDHIRPVAKGGTNDRKNLTGACRLCNTQKSAREDWPAALGVRDVA